MGNRTTLVDNNTWNNSHIALVGKAMSSTEEKAIKIMRMLGVDYVLVIFGGMIGYSGDDINKFLWMVRIAEGEHPQDIKVGVTVWSVVIKIIVWSVVIKGSALLFPSHPSSLAPPGVQLFYPPGGVPCGLGRLQDPPQLSHV